MLFSFGILPPAPLAASFNAIRARLDPVHGAKTVAHITLKQPFELGDPRLEEQVVSTVTKICAAAQPFVVQIKDVGVFHTQTFGSVVHLVAHISTPLRELHRELVLAVASLGLTTQGLDPLREQHVFYPHLTLAQGLTHEEARAALSELPIAWSCSFRAHEIVIARRDGDQVWSRPYARRLGPSGEGDDAARRNQALEMRATFDV